MTDVLAVAEHRRGELRDISYELVTAGRTLADESGGDLHMAVISGDVDEYADALAREGVDEIHTVAAGEEFNHDRYVAVLEQLADELDPSFIVAPNSVNGLDYAPAIAGALDQTLVTDAVALDTNGEDLTVNREMYGSKVETVIEVDEGPFVVTVRGGEFPPAESVAEPTVTEHDFDLAEEAFGTSVKGYEEVGAGDVDISEADFLVSVGRGIEEEENLELIEELADAAGATVSSSRPIVDNGWLPKNRQVGQSGKTVTPTVYLAIGISGAVQHVAGMKGAETIIAINKDPNAPIFDIADYGVVGDLFDVVPELTEQL